MQINKMKTSITFWVTVFMTIIFIANASIAKKLDASQAFDDTWNTATDLENELEQKRNKSLNSSGNDQWSRWSDWSTCSRSCDGGIMQQIRRCRGNSCRGENVRFRICNMQACPEVQDFRARQCATFDDVPYDGTLYRWTPHYDYLEPCALTCRGRPAHLPEEDTSLDIDEDSDHYEEPSVIVQLSSRVQDGTRCRSGSLDMCIQGKCQRVGCDLKIGSTKKIDSCGICGGDGNSCSQALHQWETSPSAPCSVSCGGGYKMSRSICRNRLNGAEVNDSLCNAANRPEPSVSLCNTHTCPPRWIADDWSPCSRLCGQGYRERMVVCAEEKDGIKTRVADIMCQTPRPPTQEPCMIEECPKWEVEEWTQCSVSCGQGIQMRGVECKSSDGSLSAKCDPVTKPNAAKQCNSGTSSCDVVATTGGDKYASGTIIVGSSGPRANEELTDSDSSQEEDVDDEADAVEDDEEEDDVESFPAKSKLYQDSSALYAHRSEARLYHEEPMEPRAERLVGKNNFRDQDEETEPETPTADPTFIKDTIWSPCSVTCGEGIRRRAYKCKIFLEYSRTIATVNDTLCEGAKPQDEVERCVEEPCTLPSHGYEEQYPRDSIKVGVSEPGKTYVWREQGYTSCSASCLGGVEELIINCVREDNGRVVSPFLCAPESKPEARVRTCNDRPCPPRWNYSDYTPCSKSCGIGIKTREIQCIHEVTRGGENTMVVPNSMCPQPPPADRQYCNVLDCPVRWEVGEWSKCSHTCGYGFKERKVECKQIMAQEHKIERPESMCPSVKPGDKKPCNVKPCPPEDPKPVIQMSNTTHIQHDPKKSRITLKIGGAGIVFFGTQVKIKCPVKRYNRTKIKWSKDHKPLTRSRRFQVSKKGALKILDISFSDAGVYSCHAGLSSAEILIEVKPKPGQQMDELKRQESDRLVRERSGIEALTSVDMTATEGGVNRQQQSQNGRERNRRPKPTADNSVIDNNESALENQQIHLVSGNADGLPQPASASSGGSRQRMTLLWTMPYFQTLLNNLQFLWPLQRFSNSRAGQHFLLNKGIDIENLLERYEQDEPIPIQQTYTHTNTHRPQPDSFKHLTTITTTNLPTTSSSPSTFSSSSSSTSKIRIKYTDANRAEQVEDDEDDEEEHKEKYAEQSSGLSNKVIVGEVEVEAEAEDEIEATNITYEWQVGKWSICATKCGNTPGIMKREVYCLRHAQRGHINGSLEVQRSLCEKFATAVEPVASQQCGVRECAVWQTSSWTPCQHSRCLGRHIAVQKRDVRCQFTSNGTDALDCEATKKPISRKECYNPHCKGAWRVEPWSECNAPCGRSGIKYRIIQCVWYGTRRPAGNACRNQSRPAVMKACKAPACNIALLTAQLEEDCKDTSRYCRNVRSIGLCRLHRYQEKCCKSCKINNNFN